MLGQVLSGLHRQVPDRHRIACELAGTFIVPPIARIGSPKVSTARPQRTTRTPHTDVAQQAHHPLPERRGHVHYAKTQVRAVLDLPAVGKSNVVQTANAASPQSMSLFPTRTDWDTARAAAKLDTDAHRDMHAGELEVSILLHVQPHLVRPGYHDTDHVADERPMLLVGGMRTYTESGVIGKPSAGTAEKGQQLLASLAQSFQQHLAVLTGR
ncbi:creatininase family protein [Dactylosporangium sp. McL0621]|uniref:creatininase family protein n=1 Tax=Dactylosporangium sp. McL0621 TaxID=3415678 RepID=UPI003CEA90CB